MWLVFRTVYISLHALALCRLFSTCFLAFLFGSIYWGLGSKRCDIVCPVSFQSSLSTGGEGRSASMSAHCESTETDVHIHILLSFQRLSGIACHPNCGCTPAHPLLHVQGHCAGDPEHHCELTRYLLTFTPEPTEKRLLPGHIPDQACLHISTCQFQTSVSGQS